MAVDWFFTSNNQRCLSGEVSNHMRGDWLYHKFVQCCPVLGLDIVVVHDCCECVGMIRSEIEISALE